MKQREYGIELFRVALMFGIVFLHCAYNTVGSFSWQNNLFKWCVDGFVLISGYFGIRFSVRKALILYCVALVCALTVEGLVQSISGGATAVSVLIGAWNHLKGSWFLHAYFLMTCMSPVINHVAQSDNATNMLIPFIAVVLVWGLLNELPFVGGIMFRTSGIGSFSGLTLTAVYAIGRLYNRFNWRDKLSWRLVAIALPALWMISLIGVEHNGIWVSGWLANYDSPISLAIAVLVFWMFQQVTMHSFLQKIVLWLGPSMFPVYIYHGHPAVFSWMRECGWSLLPMAMLVFFVSVGIDLPRRLVGRVICRRG